MDRWTDRRTDIVAYRVACMRQKRVLSIFNDTYIFAISIFVVPIVRYFIHSHAYLLDALTTCEEGEIRCQPEACPHLLCSSPIIDRDADPCCPVSSGDYAIHFLYERA